MVKMITMRDLAASILDLLEARRAYDFDDVLRLAKRLEKEPPIKPNDVVKVYHGFRSHDDAILAAKRGMSGKDRPSRVYSYEADNNPKGVFVSAGLKQAKEFTGAYGPAVVIEFNARYKELEAPVWPGGGFTVQGQLSGTFGSDRIARVQAKKSQREKAKEHAMEFIRNSYKPEVAMWLLASGESQALFVGHLNPNRITKVWVASPDEKGRQRYGAKYISMSRGDFLKEYEKTLDKEHRPSVETYFRKFQPQEKWDSEVYLKRSQEEYRLSREEILKATGRGVTDRNGFNLIMAERFATQYLWPKQMPGFLRWAKREFGKRKEAEK